jgi:hypothetical protein
LPHLNLDIGMIWRSGSGLWSHTGNAAATALPGIAPFNEP